MGQEEWPCGYKRRVREGISKSSKITGDKRLVFSENRIVQL